MYRIFLVLLPPAATRALSRGCGYVNRLPMPGSPFKLFFCLPVLSCHGRTAWQDGGGRGVGGTNATNVAVRRQRLPTTRILRLVYSPRLPYLGYDASFPVRFFHLSGGRFITSAISSLVAGSSLPVGAAFYALLFSCSSNSNIHAVLLAALKLTPHTV